jgi:WD40 repeat protein
MRIRNNLLYPLVLLILSETLLVPISSSTTVATPFWRQDFPDNIRNIEMTNTSNPLILVLTSSESSGKLYALSPDKTTKWVFQISTRVNTVSASKDGSIIAVGAKGALYILDNSGKLLKKVGVPEVSGSPENTFQAVTVSSSGKYIAAICNGVLLLYDSKGTLLWYYSSTRGYVEENAISFSQNEDYLVVGFYEYGVYFFDTQTGDLLWRHLFDIGENVRVTRITPRGKIVVGTSTSEGTGKIYIFNEDGSMRINRETEGFPTSIDVSESDEIVIGTEKSGVGIVYVLSSIGKILWQYDTKNPVNAVKISNDGERIVSTGGSGVFIFDRNGEVIWNYKTNTALFYLATSPDASKIVFGSSNWIYYIEHGYLNVYSTPSLARVYLNGEYIGKTPVENYKLLEGVYNLTIALPNYREYNETVTIKPGETTNINVTLIPIGFLAITSEPSEAEVFIDRNYVGRTPLEIEVTAENHTITLTKAEYEEYSTNITVNTGERREITVKLTPKFGYINIQSDKENAEVYIDGTHVGTTPIVQYKLPVGSHILEIRHPSCKEYTANITVNPGETLTLNVELTLLPARLIVESDPLNSSVFLNGSYVGVTPLSLNLSAGKYEVKITREGYSNYTKLVELKPGETEQVTVKLEEVSSQTITLTKTPYTTETKATCGPGALVALMLIVLEIRKRRHKLHE